MADLSRAEQETASVKGSSSWQELARSLVLSFVLAFALQAWLVQPFFIPSGSMERTLHGCPGCPGDRILVDKAVYDLRDVRRGEIVVFDGADSWGSTGAVAAEPSGILQRAVSRVARATGAAPPSDTDYVKRVIGLPGDLVACCTSDGRVTVQPAGAAEPVPLDERYVFQDDDQPFCAAGVGAHVCPTGAPGVLVPDGRLWVMGDNRSGSADSRSRVDAPARGTVPVDDVIGRAFAIVWPPSRAGVLSVPDTFDGWP